MGETEISKLILKYSGKLKKQFNFNPLKESSFRLVSNLEGEILHELNSNYTFGHSSFGGGSNFKVYLPHVELFANNWNCGVEIGHYIIKNKILKEKNYFETLNSSDNEKTQAINFAVNLLLPSEKFIGIYNNKNLRNYELENFFKIPQALIIARAEGLGLL